MIFAVMSDLHIGLAARAKDLCPVPPKVPRKDYKKYDSKSDANFRQDFVDFIASENIRANYLVLPGDITNRATPQEVALASEFILQAADALQVPHDRIVFTPGNHDVDWTVVDPTDMTGIRWDQRYVPIGSPRFHFRNLINNGDGDILSTPYFTAWTFDNLLVLSYNSASHDTPTAENGAHHGLADPLHLAQIRNYLTTNPHPEGQVRLFLVHHHMLDFSEPILDKPDFSLMTNAENLLNLLHEFGFDLVIHGHKHQPRFETHCTQTFPHLPILCAGSFSVEIDTQWAGTIDNQFHIVNVNGRDGTENNITGTITSWTNNRSRGWIPSDEFTSGIHHVIPFGNYVMPNELDVRLEPFIREWLLANDHILWSNVVGQFPELEHLPLKSAIEAFNRMARLLGRETMYKSLKHLILY